MTSNIAQITSEFAAQWSNPVNVLAVLQIIGGNIIQKALAQLSGSSSSYFVPVAFSFGSVSYSFEALMAVFGDGHILHNPTIHPFSLTQRRAIHVRITHGFSAASSATSKKDFMENVFEWLSLMLKPETKLLGIGSITQDF